MSRQSAVVLVFDPQGHVLALRRGPTAPRSPGCWNFPGGYTNPGEPVQQAGYRELAEEAGIRVAAGGLKRAFSYRRPGGLTHVLWVRLARRPRVTLPDGEHDRFRWVKLHNIPQPIMPGVRYIVSRVTGTPGNLVQDDQSGISFLLMFIDEKGRILAFRRTDGVWTLPKSLVPEGHPSVLGYAHRVAEHVTGLSFKREDFHYAYIERQNGLEFGLWTKIDSSSPVHLSGPYTEARWVHPPAIPQPSPPGIRHAIEVITGTTWNLAPIDASSTAYDFVPSSAFDTRK